MLRKCPMYILRKEARNIVEVEARLDAHLKNAIEFIGLGARRN